MYIASNEDTPHFFDFFKELYVLSILSDFRNFWEEGSEWWNQTSHLFEASDVERFDGMMAVSLGVGKRVGNIRMKGVGGEPIRMGGEERRDWHGVCGCMCIVKHHSIITLS